MSSSHKGPSFQVKSFNCPLCHAFAQMDWCALHGNGYTDFYQATCASCSGNSLWLGIYSDDPKLRMAEELTHGPSRGRMIFPNVVSAPLPSPDMPQEIAADFEEARQVLAASPKAAAALLRLCVQKICQHLLAKPGRIDDQIAELVKGDLPRKVQQALDTVRVIGNESVHPGTMDLNDSPEVALALFGLVNMIVHDCITKPKEVEELYNLLPQGKRDGIERRDAKPGELGQVKST